ncbi:MAG: hypothetical protein ABIO99_06735 [Candidatus Limnocylindria bacterium]
MSIRRPANPWTHKASHRQDPDPDDAPMGSLDGTGHTGPLTDRPHSREAAESQYVATRDEWIAAMRRANSGRPADLASLAIRQEAYEQATIEVERWRSAPRVAIPIEPEPRRSGIEVAIGQEMAWKRVHEKQGTPDPGLVGRLLRRVRGRD